MAEEGIKRGGFCVGEGSSVDVNSFATADEVWFGGRRSGWRAGCSGLGEKTMEREKKAGEAQSGVGEMQWARG